MEVSRLTAFCELRLNIFLSYRYPTLLLLHPQLAANVLDYRFTRLQPALDKAQAYGYKGSMFPWESAFTGFEVHPTAIDRGGL